MSQAPAGELDGQAPAPGAQQDAPQLLHSGTYAVYRTPAGGLHVVYRRTAGWDAEAGEVRQVDGAADEHLPELGPAVVAMFGDIEAGKRPSPAAMLRAVMGRNGAPGAG